VLVFLDLDFTLPALTIANRYRHRWQVDLFLPVSKTQMKELDEASSHFTCSLCALGVCV